MEYFLDETTVQQLPHSVKNKLELYCHYLKNRLWLFAKGGTQDCLVNPPCLETKTRPQISTCKTLLKIWLQLLHIRFFNIYLYMLNFQFMSSLSSNFSWYKNNPMKPTKPKRKALVNTWVYNCIYCGDQYYPLK